MGLVMADSLNDSDNVSAAGTGKLLKLIRMARIFRILRMIRFFTKFRVMVTMIAGSLNHLFWLFVLLVVLMYIFAIILTQGAIIWLQANPLDSMLSADLEGSQRSLVKSYFGSILETMYTLYKSMLGGENWHSAADTSAKLGSGYFIVFLFYIFFVMLSVVKADRGVGGFELRFELRLEQGIPTQLYPTPPHPGVSMII